jgi:hypothetical protein
MNKAGVKKPLSSTAARCSATCASAGKRSVFFISPGSLVRLTPHPQKKQPLLSILWRVGIYCFRQVKERKQPLFRSKAAQKLL